MQALQSSQPLVCQSHPDLIDSLPYIDDVQDYLPAATRLIEEELKALPAKDYLKDLPAPEVRDFGDYMKTKPENRLKSPPNSLSEAQIQYEYRQIQLLNLDLLSEYAPEGWQRHLHRLDAYKARLEHQIADLTARNERINRERKQKQESMQETLRLLHRQWLVLCHKGRSLHREIRRLRETLEGKKQAEDGE